MSGGGSRRGLGAGATARSSTAFDGLRKELVADWEEWSLDSEADPEPALWGDIDWDQWYEENEEEEFMLGVINKIMAVFKTEMDAKRRLEEDRARKSGKTAVLLERQWHPLSFLGIGANLAVCVDQAEEMVKSASYAYLDDDTAAEVIRIRGELGCEDVLHAYNTLQVDRKSGYDFSEQIRSADVPLKIQVARIGAAVIAHLNRALQNISSPNFKSAFNTTLACTSALAIANIIYRVQYEETLGDGETKWPVEPSPMETEISQKLSELWSLLQLQPDEALGLTTQSSPILKSLLEGMHPNTGFTGPKIKITLASKKRRR